MASGSPPDTQSLLKKELNLLSTLLQQNKNQHRSAIFYRKFVEVRRCLASFIRTAQRSKNDHSPQPLADMGPCVRLAKTTVENSRHAVALLQQTYFMPFALVTLAAFARIFVLAKSVLRAAVATVDKKALSDARELELLAECQSLLNTSSATQQLAKKGHTKSRKNTNQDVGELLDRPDAPMIVADIPSAELSPTDDADFARAERSLLSNSRKAGDNSSDSGDDDDVSFVTPARVKRKSPANPAPSEMDLSWLTGSNTNAVDEKPKKKKRKKKKKKTADGGKGNSGDASGVDPLAWLMEPEGRKKKKKKKKKKKVEAQV